MSRRRRRAWIAAAALALAACGSGASSDDLKGAAIDPPRPKPRFTLTDTSGEAYDFHKETEGKTALLYFGYVHCPDICPVHLAQLAEVFEQIPAVAREVEVVFVSVDPERDTPDALRTYLDRFDPTFVGLTGSLDEVEAAQTAADVPVAQFAGEGPDYTVNHAAMVIAYSPDGLNHAIYPFGTRQSEWKNDLPLLVEMTGAEGG